MFTQRKSVLWEVRTSYSAPTPSDSLQDIGAIENLVPGNNSLSISTQPCRKRFSPVAELSIPIVINAFVSGFHLEVWIARLAGSGWGEVRALILNKVVAGLGARGKHSVYMRRMGQWGRHAARPLNHRQTSMAVKTTRKQQVLRVVLSQEVRSRVVDLSRIRGCYESL